MIDESQRCSYVLPIKGRKCRMLVKKGRRFCGEHAIFDPDQSERIQCPNDPRHTVNRSELDDHLAKRCNSRLLPEPWIVPNVNVVEVKGESETQQCLSGRSSEEQLSRMSTIIQMAFRKVSSRIIERVLRTPQIEEHMKLNKEMSDTHRKHLIQLSSIIGNLMEANLLNNDADACVIDLGAGKAQLSYWMAFIQRCNRYTGKSFLTKRGIDGEDDFSVLRYIATWAVCGMMRIGESQETEAANDANMVENVSWNWTREQKENLGCQAKALLEIGRAEYLQSLGYTINVYRYVDFSLSPENLLIVGTEN